MAELHFYDFDGTLFRSPFPPATWGGNGWWNNVESLIPPCVPERPDSSWWVGPTVSKAKQSISNSDVYAVMTTGRPAQSGLRYRVPELLKQKGLNFDEVHLAPPSGTLSWKKKLIAKFLSRYPHIDTIRVWDDRPSHLKEFERVADLMGIDPSRVFTQLVRAKPQTPECGESTETSPLPDRFSYLALFLDARSRAAVTERWPYTHHKAHGDHITLSRDKNSPLVALVGQRGSAQVVGYAEDSNGQVLQVDLQRPLKAEAGTPHLTLSVDDGVGPKYSNDLIKKGPVQRVQGLTVTGIVDVFPRSLKSASSRRVAARYSAENPGGSAMNFSLVDRSRS
jgi:hypothetical protein